MVSGPATSDQQTEVTASSSAQALERQLLRKGHVVGRYVVLSMLGSGGMGVVYAAYDPELDRKVALKLLHHENTAPEGRRRLMREAQAMARLTHPAVVTVHDVGQHDGRVFVAMEYVEGVTLREWLRGTVRPWREVLQIYLRAGRGLVAAHALGLVHRDFKPDNVMVAVDPRDPEGPIDRVRVMDFGLARAFGPLTDRDAIDLDDELKPRFDALDVNVTIGIAGTPAYMAPEQQADAEIDARADQFAFCVSVWEGVYGEKPFDVENLAELAVAQLAGRIQMPRKKGVPQRIRRALERGLAPQPEKRFATMEALLAELERDPSRRRAVLGIAGGAVLAMGGVATWIVVDRNRSEAACETEGAAIANVWNDDARERVRAGLVAASPDLGQATAERVEPRLDAYASAWEAARTQACVAATIEQSRDAVLAAAAEACLDERFARLGGLVDVLSQANSDDVWQATESASELAPIDRCGDEAWLRLRPAPPDDPDARARVEEVREELQRSLPASATRPEDAARWLADTLEKAEAIAWQPLVAEAQLHYGIAVNGTGRHADAEKILLDAYLNALAAGDDATAAETAAMLTSVVGYYLGRHEEGLLWGRTGETLSTRIGEADAHLAARLLSSIGLVMAERGDFVAALDHHRRSLALWEATVGPEHTEVAREHTNAGMALWKQGQFADGIAEFETALAMWNAAVGPEHPEVALLLNNLGSVNMEQGDLDEAEALFQRARDMRARTVGVRHTTYATTLANLGAIAQTRGQSEAALGYFKNALEILTANIGDKHPRVAIVHSNIGNTYLAVGRYTDAETHLRRAIEIVETSLGRDHASLAMPLTNLGAVEKARGKLGDAKALFERAVELFEQGAGPDHPQLAVPLQNLGEIALDDKRFDDAVVLLERALALQEAAKVEGAALAKTQIRLAHALHGLHRDPDRVRSLATAARASAFDEEIAFIEEFLAELDH